jgi:uncharacterized membrane protein
MSEGNAESGQAEHTPEDGHPLSCAACRVIDRADGVEDGQLGNPEHYGTASSRDLFALMRRVQDHTADSVTAFAGSMRFVYIHIAWFGAWIALNVGLAGVGHEFDPYPFGLLTMIVSLEAIFLATFVMISQNRQAARSDLRSQLDFENNVRGEIWSVHIGEALGLDVEHVEEIVRRAIEGAQLAMRNAPVSSKDTTP